MYLKCIRCAPQVWYGRRPGDIPILAKPFAASLVWCSQWRTWCVFLIPAVSVEVSSTRVRHMAGLRDKTQWSPYIECHWITKIPADHTCHIITGADVMKWNKMIEMNVDKCWIEIPDRGKLEKLWENIQRSRFIHYEAHMEWARRELGIPAVEDERLTASPRDRRSMEIVGT